MKRERGCCQAPARAAAAVPHRKPGHTALPPPQRRSDSSGGGDQRAAERCQAPSCVEHTLLSAQVEPHRAPAAPLISTASLGNQFRPSLPARDVQTQGTRAKGNAELCHRHHHYRSFLVCLALTSPRKGPAPGTRGAALGSPAHHSREFWDQKAKGSTWQAPSIQQREGCRAGRGCATTPAPALIPRTDWPGPAAQSRGKRQRKGQGRERTVLDRCSRLKYLEGVNTERREDLFREPRGRKAKK